MITDWLDPVSYKLGQAAGGGGGGGVTVPGLEMVVVTMASDETSITIPHSLGRVPNYALALCSFGGDVWRDIGSGSNTIFHELLASNPETQEYSWSYDNNKKRATVDSFNRNLSAFYGATASGTPPGDMTSTDVTFATGNYYNSKFEAGFTYLFIFA